MNFKERKKQLQNLLLFIKEQESHIIQALKEDLGKPVFETCVVELGSVKTEINYALEHLRKWLSPRKYSTPLIHQPAQSYVQHESLGKILIISPWNYPFQLALAPLVGSISAGNQSTLKPSELAPCSARLLAEKLPNYIQVQVQEGGPEVTQKLLQQKWDHIFFTGGQRVAKIIYEKAAQTLTPVTLELGGKCPTIVDKTCHIRTSARRIVWGKFLNVGQTCVAPDYLLVHKNLQDSLIQELQKAIQDFFGKNPEKSPDYGRIVNQPHMQRLIQLLPGATTLYGGNHDLRSCYFAPTLQINPELEHALMQEEIFGPILPILPFEELDQAIDFVNQRPKPLALYYFSEHGPSQQRVLKKTRSGGICINDTISHLGIPALPFGGVGESGFGAYHGQWGFERFSHTKAIYKRSTLLDIPVRYAPYTATNLKIAKVLS